MIPRNDITNELVKIIRDLVGDQLSTTGPPGAELGSVIKDRSENKAPKYPYIVVDYLRSQTTDAHITSELSTDTDNIEYVTDTLLFYRITCYGQQGHEIMDNLKSKLRFESYRQRLRSVTGAAFSSESDVGEIPELDSVEWIDNGYMDITLSYVDSEVDSASTVVESIEINAGSPSDSGVFAPDSTKILDVNVNVP